MPCEKCGGSSTASYDFVVDMDNRDKEFGERFFHLGKWHADLCAPCVWMNQKRKIAMIGSFLGLFIVGGLLRFILLPTGPRGFPPLDVVVILIAAGLLAQLLRTMLQSAKTKGEFAAVRLHKAEYAKDGLSLTVASWHSDAPTLLKELPSQPPKRRMEVIKRVFPAAAEFESSHCDVCGCPSASTGLTFPLVAAYRQRISSADSGPVSPPGFSYSIQRFSLTGFKSISVLVCSDCLQKAYVHTAIQALKKAATGAARRAFESDLTMKNYLEKPGEIVFFTPEQYWKFKKERALTARM